MPTAISLTSGFFQARIVLSPTRFLGVLRVTDYYRQAKIHSQEHKAIANCRKFQRVTARLKSGQKAGFLMVTVSPFIGGHFVGWLA